jgi:hypothetical protein
MTTKVNSFLRNLWYGYRFTAVTLLNILVALVLLNAILSAVFMVWDHLLPNPVLTKYGHLASTLRAVYKGLSEREIDDLLKETWSRPFVYEPFTQFKERPYRGFYVNVDSNGFRITKNQGPWPPQSRCLNIFLFGGSTTFGYGVPDGQTIASYLQEYLATRLDRDVRVYNFGRGYYYSTQERILYEELLASGFVPHMAIFIDGMNDFGTSSNEPLLTDRLREFVDHGKTSVFVSTTSLGRATSAFRRRLSKLLREEEANVRKYSDPKVIDLVIKRYLTNKKLIEAVSKPFGVKPIFVWQPNPMYQYDLRYHPYSEGGHDSTLKYAYEHMAELIRENPLDDNFLWSANIQNDAKEPLYVDMLHYSGGFSKQIATVIADWLVERQSPQALFERSTKVRSGMTP